MDLKKQSRESHITNKLKWINNHTFKLINDDGVERIIDYTDGQFIEVSSNVAPFFDQVKDSEYKYYISKSENNY